MERDRLKPDEVAARGYGGRDGRRPGRVVGDHLAGTPGAIIDGAREETGFIDLEPLERVRVHASAGRARALGEVGEL